LLAEGKEELGFDPKLIHLPFRPLVFPFRLRVSWVLSHLFYFPVLCGKREPKSLPSQAMKSNDNYVEISGYSFVGWGVVAVDDAMVIHHEFSHVEAWLGDYSPNKLAFNLVPLIVAGIFVTPFLGLGPISLALSLTLVLTFSLMAFVKIFH
jgi:hypothetical protein